MSRHSEYHDKVPKFPFYEEARKAIPDRQEWDIAHDEGRIDCEYLNNFLIISNLSHDVNNFLLKKMKGILQCNYLKHGSLPF